MLYYNIGRVINEHKSWGNKFIDNLAADIKLSFPNTTGYSVRNLKYMAKFAATYPDEEFVQTVSAQIPWSHNVALLDKVKNPEIRIWYMKKTIENGWSHSVLVHQIESGLYERQAIADKISNFENRLASPQSELAVQTMKDPYVFDFIPFKEDMVERDIEQALVKDITKLLLELGTGFVSRQFGYHAGDVTEEHKANAKLKSSATTKLVSQIVLSGGRTLSYEYDAEERITKVVDSVDGVTEYTYDALGRLLTETQHHGVR